MFKKFLSLIFGAVITLGLLGLSAPTPAQAEVTGNTTVSYGAANVVDSTVVTAVADADVVGKVNLEFISKTGLTYKGKCPKVKKVTSKLLKSKKCFVLKAGKFVNSGRHSSGKIYRYTDYAKNTKFIKKSDGWHKADCDNFARFKRYPSLTVKSIALVRSFAEVSVTVKVVATASVKATADAWCKSNSGSASGSAYATGYGSAYAYASASAKTQLEATIKASGSIRTSVRTEAEGHAKVSASATASASAEAKAVCTETTPTPVTPAPKLIETDTINDVVVSNSRTITVTGTVAIGHTATLFASAKNGGSITSGKTQTVSGAFTKTVNYAAPSEVPTSGTDWVEFTLTQDDDQSDSVSTNHFVITARPATP